MVCTRLKKALWLTLGCATALAGCRKEEEVPYFLPLWEQKTKFIAPRPAVAIDIDADGLNEVVLSDSRGHVVVFQGESGKRLWSQTIEEASLTAPVAGHFWGDGSLDVAVADNAGLVYLFNGADGELLQKLDIGKSVAIAPTVLPPDPPAGGTDGTPPELRDRLLLVGDGNTLFSLVFDPDPARAVIQWESPLSGRALAPASVGDVDGDGRFEVAIGVAVSRQGLLHVLRADTGMPLTNSPEEIPTNVLTAVSLADVDGNGRDEMFFGTASSRLSGQLSGYRYETGQERFWPLWSPQAIVQKPESDPLLFQDDRRGGWAAVIQGRNLLVIRPLSGTLSPGREADEVTQSPITSRLGLMTGDSQSKPRVIFGDELGGVYDWYIEGPSEKQSAQFKNLQLGQTPVLADFDGEPGAEVLLCFPREGVLRMMKITDAPYPAEPGAIVWQTRAGTLWRAGWRDEPGYYSALRQRYAYIAGQVDRRMSEAQSAFDARNWKDAMAAARGVLAVNPEHLEARRLQRRAWVRDHLIILATSAILGTAALVAMVAMGTLMVRRRMDIKQAVELTRAGRPDDAIDRYFRVHRRFPNHGPTNAALAGLLIREDRLEPQFASVFEKAIQSRPGDPRLLRALSECYRRTEDLSPKARDVYMKALEASEHSAELRFLIGRSFLVEQRYQDAVRYLGEALAEGYQEEEVYQSLADAYLELRRDQEDVMPVLERVYPFRSEDVRFLDYVCEVYLASDRSDEVARDVAEKALEYDPSCRNARMLYIQILLEHGQFEGAWRRLEPIYDEAPDSPEVLTLVSRCLIGLDRHDDQAVQVLEKTLNRRPDDPEILTHLSHVFLMRGWFDPHAAEIHRRAFERNPDDDRVVEAMARLAEREGDDEAQARYLERLLSLGRENRDLLLWLSRVYRSLGVYDERARHPHEVAFEENPSAPEVMAALGRVYIETGETSPQAMAILGRLHDDGADLPGLERHLIAVLNENNEWDALVGLCDAYLEKYRQETEVRRIRAHARLKTGQSSQAIDEYERLLDEGPENDRVVNDLGLAYAETGRTDDRAISIYKRALRVAPESPALLRALARAHVERGDLQEAIERFRAAMRARKESAGDVIEDCETLLKADSTRTALRWFLCEVLIRSGRFREATEHLRLLYERDPSEHQRAMKALGRILEVDPENTRAHRARGEMLLRLGAIAQARADLEKADSLKPNQEETETLLREVYEKTLQETEDAEIRFRLGRIYRRFDDLDAALRCFQKSVHDYRFETESIREMGKIFMDKNLLDLALEEFQKIAVDENLKETLYRLGQMYEQRGDPGGARAAYRSLFAADAGYRDVQKRFEALSGDGSGERTALDRTMIISQLSEKAKHRYKLLEEIGRGAMGIVYRAMDSELDEVVALKILPDNLSSNDDALTRFRREARSARRLSHRNIVRIHDIGEEMGRKYISMEFVEGTTLKALIRASGGLEVLRTVKYAAQILDALAYAHSIGIVHRDIKPANIIISRDDEVKITDFGIAKILESTDATAEGAVVGTPLYMSPEQVRGEPVDHRADIYSVGILLYESIEGRPPFLKGDLAYSHLHVFPDPMTRGPEELNDIVLQALEKRKEDRWTSAQAMLDALQALNDGG